MMNRCCPICGYTGRGPDRIVQDSGEFHFFSDGPGKAVRLLDVQCPLCYALYRNPTFSPEEEELLFAEAGASYGDGGRAKEQAQWVKEVGCSDISSVLDYGCGSGKFLSLVDASQKLGVETNLEMAGVASSRGITVWPRLSGLSDERFSTITMFHVLEHLSDPVGTLKALRIERAAHDTTLVVEVPILEQARNQDVTGFMCPQHVTHFTIRTLTMAMNMAGWSITSRYRTPGHNGMRVTAKPVARVSNLTGVGDDLLHLRIYQAWRAESLALIQSRVMLQGNRSQVVVWGAGLHTESLHQFTTMFEGKQIVRVVDSDKSKQGKLWRGIKIWDPESLTDLKWDRIGLIVSSYGSQEEITEQARKLGVPEGAIWRLYDADRIEVY